MKIFIADPFALMRGSEPIEPTPPEPRIEQTWFLERRNELRSSCPPPFVQITLPTAKLDDPIADSWFR